MDTRQNRNNLISDELDQLEAYIKTAAESYNPIVAIEASKQAAKLSYTILRRMHAALEEMGIS